MTTSTGRPAGRPRPAVVLGAGVLVTTAACWVLGTLLSGWTGGVTRSAELVAGVLVGCLAGALVLVRFHRRGTLARHPTEFAGIGLLAALVAVLVLGPVTGLLLGDVRAAAAVGTLTAHGGQLVVLAAGHLVMAALLRPALVG